jgi:heme exporter protein D
MYLFYLFQSLSVFTTTIATSYNKTNYIWLGVGLSLISTLINIYEKLNISLSSQILKDIEKIKNNSYVDDDIRIDDVKNKS